MPVDISLGAIFGTGAAGSSSLNYFDLVVGTASMLDSGYRFGTRTVISNTEWPKVS
jgi:hypothetical protein